MTPAAIRLDRGSIGVEGEHAPRFGATVARRGIAPKGDMTAAFQIASTVQPVLPLEKGVPGPVDGQGVEAGQVEHPLDGGAGADQVERAAFGAEPFRGAQQRAEAAAVHIGHVIHVNDQVPGAVVGDEPGEPLAAGHQDQAAAAGGQQRADLLGA